MYEILKRSIERPHHPRYHTHIFDKQEFFFIMVLNLILLTVYLTFFKIGLLFMMFTFSIKLYKTYMMNRAVERIEISSIPTLPKTSIVVHYFAKLLHTVLEEKKELENLKAFALLTALFLFLKNYSINYLLMFLIDWEYGYLLYQRYLVKVKTEKELQIEKEWNEDQSATMSPRHKEMDIRKTESVILEESEVESSANSRNVLSRENTDEINQKTKRLLMSDINEVDSEDLEIDIDSEDPESGESLAQSKEL